VISACGKSMSNKCNVKVGSTEESPATKCSLNFWMARSEAVRRWQWGGTNWYPTSLVVKEFFNADDASLWRVLFFGLKPLTVSS
jgi:hypothetical protein